MRDRTRVQTVNNEPSMTRQSMAAECDINNILRQNREGIALAHFARHGGSYTDVPAASYHTACNVKAQVDQLFESLPSEARAAFRNDPGAFLEAAADPERADEFIDLGLCSLEELEAAELAAQAAETRSESEEPAELADPAPDPVDPPAT